MARNLLLISDRPDDMQFAAQVATVAQLTILNAKTPKDGADVIAREGAPVIFLDASTEELYQEFETAVQNSIGLFSDKISTSSLHFLASSELDNTPYVIQSPLFGNFIMRQAGAIEENGIQYGRVVRSMMAKRAFGLKQLLDPSAKIQVVKLTNSNQKSDAVEAVRSFLVAGRFQARMATVAANAVDEVLLNAIYDAPIDDVGRPIYKLSSRAAVLTLEGKGEVEMQVGYDGRLAAVSVIDNYGSLDKGSLLAHLGKTYQAEEYKVKGTVANAGIGLATVFRNGGSMFFVSESRLKTEVTLFFKRTENFRDFKSQFRFLATQFYF